MSSVKALPVGHVSSPMYVVMERSPHEGNAQYKRPPHPSLPGGHHSPPLAGTRGYPYPQDPSCRNSSSVSYVTSATNSSPHMATHAGGGSNSIYTTNHIYRETHFQVDSRQVSSGGDVGVTSRVERYAEQQQHSRRRLSLRPPAQEFLAAAPDRERYMEAIRYQYEREVALGVPYTNAAVPRGVKPLVVSVHTPSEMDVCQPGKRPRLAVEPKAPVHQPLVIDTRNIVIKKEPAYTPQVEAISPTLPPEEGRCDSPMRILKENILGNINRLDKEINQVESQVTKLQKKMHELEVEASKPAVMKEAVKDISHIESKQMSIAQIIYSENRAKALESHAILEKLGQKVEIPMYNQPSDTVVYHENKRKFLLLKSRLMKCFKKRHREREMRDNHLTETYSKLMQEWLKKIEKKETNATKKAKDAKVREFFEKQFPELKKQREDKERITRVSQRIRSDAEWEEIIDGLQEQELEEKKMRSYAVIPPIILDSRQRRLWYINKNGFVEDLSEEYKEKQMLNIWTNQEKEIFREKYLQHPKNFSLIASYLERKTVADCVQYYYLTKKGENYKQLLRKHSVRKRTRALVKPQQQQQGVQSTGMTTRQQEDAKTSSVHLSSAGSVLTASENVVTTATTTDSTTTSVVSTNTTSSTTSATVSLSVTTSAVSVTNVVPSLTSVVTDAVSAIAGCNGSLEQKVSDIGNEKENIHLPNNIRKKKELSKNENAEKVGASDSDTASDHHNENGPAQPCAVCKMELDNFNQSRALTKSNCSLFGIKDTELVGDMRVCSSCRFKSVRRRCPIASCKTPKRKVKRLRPLPGKLAEMPKDVKDAIALEFQIAPDVNKCCSACFNRIVRRLESNTAPDGEPSENSRWTEEEMEAAKKGMKQFGSDWEAVATIVVTKNKEQCRNFYFNYKRKLCLEEIIKQHREEKGDKGDELQDEKPPPIVTDEEESGETTSSCEEDNCVDRCSSDTASAPSPADKIIEEVSDKTEDNRPAFPTSVNQPSLNPDDQRQQLPHLDASPKCPADYDSSATVSADEGQNQNDIEMRDPSPRIIQQASHQPAKLPVSADPLRKAYHPVLPLKEMDNRPVESGVPLVKTLLQDPNIGAAHSEMARPAYLDQQPPSKSNKDEPTCVRDLIYQAIEMSLQWPAKPGRNNSPIPAAISKENAEIVHVESAKELSGSSVPIPPTAHCGSHRPSRPGSHTDLVAVECEVQDLSKKAKSRDNSPPREYAKRERIAPPARPPSESSNSSSHGHYYGAPPPAHCNQYRSSQPPPALSPHYVAEPHHETYYPRSAEPRSKTYTLSERPHSQPPHLVAQSPATLATTPPLPSHPKTVVAKSAVPPPPPLIASKPTQLSPKMTYKDRLVTLPPTGSITQGTPVNQQQQPMPPGSSNLPSARYEGFLRQLPPPQTKDGGSITLGTPVQHEQVRRIPGGRADVPAHMAPAVYDPAVVEYYRHVTPAGQPYPFSATYPGYPAGAVPQRPPYANESQLSSKQIMIDFNTSKQMQLRRGGISGEKEMKVSPRVSESNPSASETHLHSMYPPMSYPAPGGSPYTNQIPAGYQPTNEARFTHHRVATSQADRNRSPSGTESPVNVSYSHHPGKRSPGLAQAAGRQNVIHRSITWGTGKPSVIQAPQSASPRTNDGRTEASSPATMRKSTPSPRHPQPLIYSPVPPSGHDAFNTLVNAAVAQPSLVVPKDGKGSPAAQVSNARQDTKSPRDRPVVEGLEKTLIDMHQRPRSYTDSGHRSSSHQSHQEHGRNNNDHISSEHRQMLSVTPDGHRYVTSLPHSNYDLSREQHHRHPERQQLMLNEHPASSLRLPNMREPFSREQFERQMRQPEVSVPRERSFIEKDHDRGKSLSSESHAHNYGGHSQQSDLDNEASKIFSQSFQKDAPRSGSSPRGFTAANLIDAIITRQINQNAEAPAVTKNSTVDLFNQYHPGYEEPKVQQRPANTKLGTRTEVVTIDDEPENEKCTPNWNERPGSHGRSPVPQNAVQNILPVTQMQYPGDKVYTLGEHIAAIISKDYNSPNDVHQSQPFYSNSQLQGNANNAGNRNSPYTSGVPLNSHPSTPGKQLEGIAAALPTEGILANPIVARDQPDHSPQNCPGNGCIYHTHSWKLRRALQQDRDREHRSPVSAEGPHQRPMSAQTAESPVSQDERQIIRVTQTASPSVQNSMRSSPLNSYTVEPISPPSQLTESPTVEGGNRNRSTKGSSSELSQGQSSVWASSPSITGLLTTRHLYPQEYPEGPPPPPPVVSHYGGAPSSTPLGSGPSNRPPHQQQQMGLSPLDYVKNRIVEVMRIATDDNPEGTESRRLLSSHPDERDHQVQQHTYRFQQNTEREITSERPCSTGNGIAQMQNQRYSPAVSRFSPVPPRPSSAAERVPSRNSTPSELSRHHKRTVDGHHVSNEWRDNHVSASRVSSRSVSPSSSDAQDTVPRKKSRSDGTFIPESSTDRAPVLLPESTVNVHRPASHAEAPRLSSNNHNSLVTDSRSASKSVVSGNLVSSQSDSFPQPSQAEMDCQKFRNLNETRSENQWDMVSAHDKSVDNRLRALESSNVSPASSTTVETVSPPTRDNVSTTKNLEASRGDTVTGSSPVTSSGVGQPEPSRSSPVTSSQGQRNASSTTHGFGASSTSSGHYPPYSASNGGVSSSSSTVFSSATSLQPPANQHIAYSSFSGMSTTYAYPYSALTMRSLAASTTHSSTPVTNSTVSVAGSHVSPMSINNSARNSPSPLSRNNQPPPLLSSQYEPLSDED